jgi:hypothetical protein
VHPLNLVWGSDFPLTSVHIPFSGLDESQRGIGGNNEKWKKFPPDSEKKKKNT